MWRNQYLLKDVFIPNKSINFIKVKYNLYKDEDSLILSKGNTRYLLMYIKLNNKK